MESHRYEDIKSLDDLDKYMLIEIINFFKVYNQVQGKEFKVLDNVNRQKTHDIIKKSIVSEETVSTH